MRGRRHKLQVSTFPFLAVLLCAMGALILVLLVMDRKAHRAAQMRAQREAARMAEERAQGQAAQQAERERLQEQARKDWQQKRDAVHDKLTREQVEMQLQMRKVREQLQDIAARLHYEQDTSTDLRRKTQGERDRLKAEELLLRTLRSRSEQTGTQSKESSQALRRMTLDLLQMEQALKDLKASRQREQKTFSVVPFHGRRGENRRPIYVECTSDAVIFHPERKVIPRTALLPGAEDPTTSLRAEVARRVAKQRAKHMGQPVNADENPYLLLLVRPSGINTYNYLYHSALKDLHINDKEVQVDFGYEFIDDDWVLDFPADDEQPSSQPWMIAGKSSAAPAVVPPRPAIPSPSPRTNDHPIALAPMGDAGGGLGGVRGFRASENGGAGNWVRDPQARGAPPGTRVVMAGSGSTGGAWSSQGGGGGGTGSSSSLSGSSGVGGGGGIGAAGAGGSGSNRLGYSQRTSAQSSGGAALFSPSSAFAPGGGGGSDSLPSPPGGGRGSGNEGGGGGGSFGVMMNRGSGRGHPAALAPSSRDGGGGGDDSGDGGPPPNGLVGSGVFSLGQPGAARGYGSSMQGSSGAGGSGVPGVGGSGVPGAGGSGVPGAGGSGVPGVGGPGVSGAGGSGSSGGMNYASPGIVSSGSPGFVGSGPPGAGVSGVPGVGGVGTPGLGTPGSPGVGPSGNSGVAGAGSPGVGIPGSPGAGGSGSPGVGGSDLPGLGPPRALSSSPRDGYAGSMGQSGGAGTGSGGSGAPGGTGQSGSGATGSGGNGAPGNGTAGGGSPGSAIAGSATGTGSPPNGRYVIAQANNGGVGSATGSYEGGGATGTGSSATAGAAGSGGSSPGTPSNNGSTSSMQGSGGSYSGTPSNNGSNPPMPGQGGSSPGTQPVMGGSSGSQSVMGGSPGTQAPGGTSMPANGGRSSDVVIYVDPLTGKPTAPPPQTSPPDGSTEQQSQESDGQPRPPRVRVVTAGSGGSGGGSGDPQAEKMNRFAPTPSLAPERHKPVTPHPIWVHGGRDWTIYVECRADALVLYPSERAFPLTQITSDPANNALAQAIRQMIDHRQALRRPGEPPYRPQVCLLVRPEYRRTFLTVYPALEALPVPRTYRNLDADDDVIDIVNGTSP